MVVRGGWGGGEKAYTTFQVVAGLRVRDAIRSPKIIRLFFGQNRLQCPDFRFWRNCVFRNGPRSRRKLVTWRRCGSARCRARRGCCTSPNTVYRRRSFRFRARPWWTAVAVATVRGLCGCWTALRSSGRTRSGRGRSRNRKRSGMRNVSSRWRHHRLKSRKSRSRRSGQTQKSSTTSHTRARRPRWTAANRLSPTTTTR